MPPHLVLIAVLLSHSLIAQDQPEAEEVPKPKVSETMVVTATRSERDLSGLPISTTVLDESDIEAAPAATADDILRTIPGVHLPIQSSTVTLNIQQTISMHGLGGTRALVLLDGIPLHDAYDGGVSWQRVPLDSLRQVEVVRGGGASLFGNYALGGTIHLLTGPVERTSIGLDTSYGSFDTMRGALSAGYLASDSLSLRLNHDRHDSDGYVRVVNRGPIDIPAWSSTSVTSARADFQPAAQLDGFLKATLSEVQMSSGNNPSASDRDFIDLASGVHFRLGDRALLSATLFHGSGDERWNTIGVIGQRESSFIATDAIMPNSSTGGSFDWSLQRSGKIPFLSAGFDFRQVEASETRETFDRAGTHIRTNLVGGKQRFAGIFAQASWQPMSSLEVLASARIDRFSNYAGFDDIVGGAASNFPDTTETQLDPRLSFRYAAGSRIAIRGAAYRAFKAPTLRDLYRNSQVGTTTIVANPALLPETLTGAEIGLEWAFANAHLEVNLYRSDLEDVHIRAAVPGQPPSVIQLQNLGSTRSQGVEAMLNARLSRRWSIDAGYTYADSTVVAAPNPALIGKLVPDVAPHMGTLSLRYRGDDGLRIDLRGRTLSSSYGEPANLVAAPAHRILDVSAARPLRPWIDLYVVGENILDEEYFFVLLAPTNLRVGVPRTFTAGVKLHFPQQLTRATEPSPVTR